MLTIDNLRSATERAVQDKQLFIKLGLRGKEIAKANRIFQQIGHDQAAVRTDKVISELGYTGDDAKAVMFKSGSYFGRNYEFFEALRSSPV